MEDTTLLKVLIVDDDEHFQAIVKNSLEDTKCFKITSCESGEEAINQLSLDVYDIILLDYKMSGISGLNVLQWVHEQKLDTPIIMLTAAGSEHVAVEAMKLGAYDYIRKEQILLESLPVRLKSVYQQYLFKKEKQNREFIQKELKNQIEEVGKIFEDVLAFQKIIRKSLELISSELQRIDQRIGIETTNSEGPQFINPVVLLNEYIKLISLALNSIDDLLQQQQTTQLKRYLTIKNPETFVKDILN